MFQLYNTKTSFYTTVRALHVLERVRRALLAVAGSIAYISKAHNTIISAKKNNQQAFSPLYSY